MPVTGYFQLVRYFRSWMKSRGPGRNSIADQIPWINFEAQQYLANLLRRDMRVFEYGTGGSSLFYANRVAEVVGVEHDKVWFDVVLSAMRAGNFHNFIPLFRPPVSIEPIPNSEDIYHDPNKYVSADEKYLNKFSFFDYASAIDLYRDEYFDIVCVDGRSRPACIKHAVPKVKPGGLLILDNSDRDYYVLSLNKELSQFTKVFERFGPGPYAEIFWGITFYKKNE